MKPCPFCGTGLLEIAPVKDRFGQLRFSVKCLAAECRARGPYRDNRDEARKAWNTRAESLATKGI